MFGVKDKVLLKKRQGLFIQRTGLWKGMTRSFHINPEKPDVPLNKNDAFQKVQKRRVQEKR